MQINFVLYLWYGVCLSLFLIFWLENGGNNGTCSGDDCPGAGGSIGWGCVEAGRDWKCTGAGRD